PRQPRTSSEEDAPGADEVLVDEQTDDSEDEDDISPPPPPTRTGTTPEPTSVGRPVELQSLRRGLAKSRDADGFFGRLKGLFGGTKEIAPEIAEEIEEVLL